MDEFLSRLVHPRFKGPERARRITVSGDVGALFVFVGAAAVADDKTGVTIFTERSVRIFIGLRPGA